MALNRYSTLPKSTIINTQVLPDLGIIDKSLQRQQRNYDATAAATHKFQQDLSNKSAFGEYDNQVLAKFNEDAKNFVGSIADKDLGSPEIRNQFAGYVQSVASNPELKRIETAKALRGNFEKSYQDLSAKGKVHDNQIKLHEMQWQKYSQTGDPKDLPTEPLYEAQDLIKGRGDLVSMLKANGTDIIEHLSDGTAYKNSSKGVASDRILKAVEAQLPTYVNSAYGKQEMNDYRAGVLSGAIPKGTSFAQYITSQVLSTAQNYAYSDFSTNRDGAENSSKKDKEAKLTIPSETIGFDMNESSTKGIRFDSNGNFKVNDMKSKAFGTAFDKFGWADSPKSEEEYNAYEKYVDEIARKNKTTHKAVVEAQSKYQTVPFELYGAGQGEKLTKVLPSISTSAKITIGGKVTTLSDFYKDQRGIDLASLDHKDRKELFSEMQVVGEVKPIKGGLVTGYVVGDSQNQMIIDVSKQVIEQAIRNNDSRAIQSINADAQAKVAAGQVGYAILPGEKKGEPSRQAKLIPNLEDPTNPHIEFVD